MLSDNDKIYIYRETTRYYDIMWQKEATPRTDFIQKTYYLPKSVIDKIEAGFGFPDFKLNEDAEKKLHKFINLIREMPLEKRTDFAKFMCEEREHGVQYIRETAAEYMAGYIRFTDTESEQTSIVELWDDTLKNKINNARLYPQYKMRKADLINEINEAALIINVLLKEDMEKVSQEIQKPDTYKEKLSLMKRMAKTTVNFGIEKVYKLTKNIYDKIQTDILGYSPLTMKRHEDALKRINKSYTIPKDWFDEYENPEDLRNIPGDNLKSPFTHETTQRHAKSEPHRIATNRISQQVGSYSPRQKED